MNDLVLEIRNLSIDFRDENGYSTAVKNVSFNLQAGSVLGIVGESGSGKSVTSLSIMGLIPSPPGRIVSGEILYRRENTLPTNLRKLPEKELRKYRGKDISMIFQEPMTSLNPVITCGRQVMEAILEHNDIGRREARSFVMDLFREVQLPRPESIFKSYPHQLSGGQKQRVMIAMAISCHPRILIADEPTTALDVTVQRRILDLLKSLQEKYRMSMIFISHDLGVIAEIADQVIVMKDGEKVESGEISRIFHHPEHPYTKGLLACRPRMDRNYKRLPTLADFIMSQKKEDSFDYDKRFFRDAGELVHRRNVIYAEKPFLEVKNLKTWFPARRDFFGRPRDFIRAVDGVSFGVYPSETLGLVGESGCGKTTLGRSILRLNEPTEGQVIYKGKDLITLSASELRSLRREMQIIFQDPYSSLNPRLPVGNAVSEPMKVFRICENERERKKQTMELFERVGLEAKYFDRYPHELSGGQRQRVCIARALAVNPSFIVCDESVSALDVSVQAQILNLLNDLKKDFGFTYIFISHDLSVVRFMSDRMMVMHEGKIVEEGFAQEICDKPGTEYTKRLIGAIPKG
ncbi:MAG: ABC transporter ATP-binding protein [Bacteroidetes bacterium]|nr:ABC transporter ATP-binding protein [Bacteroidota bacterium]